MRWYGVGRALIAGQMLTEGHSDSSLCRGTGDPLTDAWKLN